MKDLKNALVNKIEPFLGVYVCQPFAVLIGKMFGNLFLIDTHPVHTLVSHPKNLKTSVIVQAPTSIEGTTELCRWLWKRLYTKVSPDEKQTLSYFIR